jgi:hypothetical protein
MLVFSNIIFFYFGWAMSGNVWLPDAVADLATEISPLAQNENSKKERTIYRKIAIAFDSGWQQFLFIVKIQYHFTIYINASIFCSNPF